MSLKSTRVFESVTTQEAVNTFFLFIDRYPMDKNTWTIDRQFLWGPCFMISPVMDEVSLSFVRDESRFGWGKSSLQQWIMWRQSVSTSVTIQSSTTNAFAIAGQRSNSMESTTCWHSTAADYWCFQTTF